MNSRRVWIRFSPQPATEPTQSLAGKIWFIHKHMACDIRLSFFFYSIASLMSLTFFFASPLSVTYIVKATISTHFMRVEKLILENLWCDDVCAACTLHTWIVIILSPIDLTQNCILEQESNYEKPLRYSEWWKSLKLHHTRSKTLFKLNLHFLVQLWRARRRWIFLSTFFHIITIPLHTHKISELLRLPLQLAFKRRGKCCRIKCNLFHTLH